MMTQMESSNSIHFPLNYSKQAFTIAIDIGGSLAKVVYSPSNSNVLAFETMETEKIAEFIDLLHSLVSKHNNNDYKSTKIIATGGGAFKFYDLLKQEFPNLKSLSRFDEMDCLIKGLNVFIHEIPDEIFTYNDYDKQQIVNLPRDSLKEEKIYPYMLVNIGSGVSILKADGPNDFKRVGGSSLGGGTLWGLLSLITGAKTYDEMLQFAKEGDNTNVDMLVGDIYGSGYSNIGLKSTHIASSFAKVFQNRQDSPDSPSIPSTASTTASTQSIEQRNANHFANADICKSLLYAISNNIGQIAYLQAKIHNVKNIYFGGSYIRGHLTTMNTLSYAINFWSKGTKKAFFLKHEGHLGAMGAFLTEVE